MKKLMIAAATAAMVGGAFADAQVWEMSLTAKTTASKIGTVKSACDACDGATSYRKQASVKIAGLFWGCTCDEMVNLTGPVSEDEGVFFWNASKKAAFYDQDAGAYAEIDFGWDILNRIGQKAADCEGVWDLAVGDFVLRGAGFGKVAGCDDAAYIKSMNGSFAGTYIAGNGCKRCEDETASAWALCDCGEADARTAAYGNWTLKYNASVTKKFRDSSDWSWYKWPGDTLEAIQELISGKPAPTPTPAELAKKQYADAKQALEAAKAEGDALVAEFKIADGDKTTAEYKDWAETVSADAVAEFKPLMKAYQTAKADFDKAITSKYADVIAKDEELKNVGSNYYAACESYINKQHELYGKEKLTEDEKNTLEKLETNVKASKNKFESYLGTNYPDLKADIVALFNKVYETASAVIVKFGDSTEEAVKDAAVDARTTELKKSVEKIDGTYKLKDESDIDKKIGAAETKLTLAAQTCIVAGVICE